MDVEQSNGMAQSLVERFFNEAIDSGCEGIMAKSLNSPYLPGKRSHQWLKLKLDYIRRKNSTTSNQGTFIPDTLDLVPIGAFYGKGRRNGVFGSFLMGSYNATTGKFEVLVAFCVCIHVYRRLAKLVQVLPMQI